jgi:anti-sigma factor RsiW
MTDYLDEALPAGQRRILEAHLRACPHCGDYVRQLRATIEATGRVEAENLTEEILQALVSLYRKTMDSKIIDREQ